MARAWLVLVSLSACSPDLVELQGVMLDGWEGELAPAAGARLTVTDDGGEVFGEAVVRDNGVYRVTAPELSNVHLLVEGDGLERATFAGVSGANPRLRMSSTDVHAVRTEAMDALRARFAGCEGAQDGTVVAGEVRIADLEDPDTGIRPVVQTAFVSIEADDGETWVACYLDDEGLAWSPDAVRTGPAGQFAVFGVPPGLHRMWVAYDVYGQVDLLVPYPVMIVEEGVAVRFPVLVPFLF